MAKSIKPRRIDLKPYGPYKAFNPLDILPCSWYYPVRGTLEVTVRVPGPDGLYIYLFTIKRDRKPKAEARKK